ncbi:TIGR01777 family oxidoreductase [Nostoc ellipsosporum NOK]|nr:TIGR01777 family oxidoreductase [Nostoc ellipsosporum NOK]
MATILITGGTGLVGKALTRALLRHQHDVIILSRSAGKDTANGLRYAKWDIGKNEIDNEAVAAADFIIHLAGAGVADKRWSEKRKKEIRDSRINSSALIVKALREVPNKVKAVISASAIGWYGPDPTIPNPHAFSEDDPPYPDFLGNTCRDWEASIDPVESLGKRLVKLRTGIVLSREGGALPQFEKSLAFGIGAVMGNGKQIVSWVHIDDLVNMYISAMENGTYSGPYNAVAPNPVSNRTLISEIGKVKKGRYFTLLDVPAFLLKIVLGEMSTEVLKSATVSSARLQLNGFIFQHPSLKEALADLYREKA